MPIKTLDHVNIRTAKLEETCDFYSSLLGLVLTTPPGCENVQTSAWLCDRDRRAVLHVGSSHMSYGDGQDGAPAGLGGGAVHHVAFDCSDYEAMLNELESRGHAVRTSDVPSARLRQIFVQDPNGITVELNFRAA